MKKRKSNRFKHYDYSLPGYYFLTICTRGHKHWFGKIGDGRTILNKIGGIAEFYINEIPNHYDGVAIDQFIVMLNHIHMIVILNNERTEHCSIPTDHRCGALLSQIVKSYKNVVTKDIRRKYPEVKFFWQRSFYDHVIRHDKSLLNIREYIVNNPAKWELDKYNSENLV